MQQHDMDGIEVAIYEPLNLENATQPSSVSCVFLYKCRASQFYRQNNAPIALVGLVIHPHNGQRDNFHIRMNRHVSIRMVLALQSPSQTH